jgi:hypothetical protein
MLACGFLAQPGKRTVCGMLSGAGLSRLWPHDRAHWFFSRARWDSGELGLAAAKLVVALLVPAGEPVLVAIDDTLFKRRGKKVWAASWFHDGSAQGTHKTGRGNTWAVLAIVVRLPFCSRPVALPVLAKLVVKRTSSSSRLWLARRMAQGLADALPGRGIHVTADSAYAGEELKKLGKQVTWTTRLRKDAALHGLPPERTGKRGRPRLRGDRLPELATLAATAAFAQVTVTRYGKTETVHAAAVTCLWYSVFSTRPVQVILVRDRSPVRLRPGPGHHRHAHRPRPGHRKIRREMGHRGRDPRRQAGIRRRAGPQPHRERGPPHHPVPARLPGHHGHLVCRRRPRPRRHRRPPRRRPLVQDQDHAGHRRHDRQAPPRPHSRQI